MLYLLAVHRAGRSAADLARDVFGDPARTVTVRAEMSRVRRYLGSLLEHRPYRFTEDAEVELLLPDDPAICCPYVDGSRGHERTALADTHTATPSTTSALMRGPD